MRMTLTGSLSQPCHPTLTLLIPHVTQGCGAQCREDYQQPLTCTSAHIYTHTRGYVEVPRSSAHVHTPEAGDASAWLITGGRMTGGGADRR